MQPPLQAVRQLLPHSSPLPHYQQCWKHPTLKHRPCALLQSSPHAVHAVSPAVHKCQHGLDDSHEPCQGILAAMKSPDGLPCIAQDENVPPLPSPRLLADWILRGACRAKGELRDMRDALRALA